MATNTYVALSTYTIPSSVDSYTFTSIPQEYTDLVLVVTGVGATGTTFPWMRFNGLSTNIYSDSALYGNGTSAGSNRRTANSRGYLAENVQLPITQIGNILVNIMNYSNSTTYKTWLVRNNNQETGTYTGVEAIVGMAQTTEAITSITIGTASGGTGYNFAAGSTFSLYGIKAWAPEVTPKATGGYVTSDASYWYHTFPFTSTFTPNQSLTADYLVVAGGGGGFQGGGGAGGLRSTVTATGGGGSLESPLSLTAQAYTVTVGAGGGAQASGNNSVFSTITSTAGGRGGSFDNSTAPATGGSGGGGGGSDGAAYNGAAGTANQGYAGGNGFQQGSVGPAGGGGGAGAVGSNGVSGVAGAGGNGVTTSITGASVTYAGGGGGGIYNDVDAGAGGTGGGGNGGGGNSPGTNALSGTANTGSGGGGAGFGTSGAGGSGIVIVRYAK
jgi:hypothetical protein